jgi:MoaA/NifB/PqqE/SkfB family radical SAM enzyme
VAFAGLGDPLLRWPDVAEITRRVREHHEVPISLYTNGLLPQDAPAAAEVASTLHAAGVTAATIALNAADPDSYERVMLSPPPYNPAYHEDAASAIGDVSGASFGTACEFVAAMAEAGVETTVTAVASADTAAVRDLGTALGAIHFKERSFLE